MLESPSLKLPSDVKFLLPWIFEQQDTQLKGSSERIIQDKLIVGNGIAMHIKLIFNDLGAL